jgi:hypothetical protein
MVRMEALFADIRREEEERWNASFARLRRENEEFWARSRRDCDTIKHPTYDECVDDDNGYNNDEGIDDDGHNNEEGVDDDGNPLDGGPYNNAGFDANGYDDAGYDDKVNDIAEELEIAQLEIALKLHSMEYDDYDDDAYDDDDYNDNIYDTKTIDKLVEECDYEQHLLWDTFLSLTSHTCVGHQMDQLVRTTTPPQPFKLVGPTSLGGSTLQHRVE